MEGSVALFPYNGTIATNSGMAHSSMQIPKLGTLIPNRIFVGGIASDTTESELKKFFSAYGVVRDCKIVLDKSGLSKSYGFVTFETQEEAERIIKRSTDSFIMKDRRLNIGPAIRKQNPVNDHKGIGESNKIMSMIEGGGLMPGAGGGLGTAALVYPNPLTFPSTPLTLMYTSDGQIIQAQPLQTAAAMYPSLIYHTPAGLYQQPIAAATPGALSTPQNGRWMNTAQPRFPAVMNTGSPMVASPCGQYMYEIRSRGQAIPVLNCDLFMSQCNISTPTSNPPHPTPTSNSPYITPSSNPPYMTPTSSHPTSSGH